MDPFVKKAGLSSNLIIGISALLVGALVIGGIAVLYTSYKRSGGLPSGEAVNGQVAISSPHPGAQLEIGEFVIVEADAIGSNAYTSLELWLDGDLVGVQSATEGATQPFAAQFSWRPVELGGHSLIAAAIDANGKRVLSAQVMVFVLQGENEINLVSQTSDVFPAPSGGGYNPPEETGSEGSTGPAGIWSGSLGNWGNSLFANEKPTAPDLVARPTSCGANLLIHDQSDNEEGFVIYRQMSNAPDWVKLGTLSSQSKVEWIEHKDEGISGIVTYYVSAFNSQGETVSNPVIVNIDPAGCPSQPDSSFAESITMSLKVTEAAAEKVYCYQSRDGINWNRWPVIGFLSPDSQGNLPVGPITMQRREAVGGGWESSPLGLFLECWGWLGGGLSRLGDLSFGELEPVLSEKQLIMGEGLSAEVEFSVDEIKNILNLFPEQLISDGEIQPVLPSNMPASPNIPGVNLSVTHDRLICIGHLPNTIQGGKDQLDQCFRYPAYDPAQDGTLPQPYIVWDFGSEPVCIGGATENCKSYQELLGLAQENGGQVGFTIQSMRNGKKTVWNLTEPNRTMFVVPPFSCIGETAFNVRMWYRPGKEGISVSTSPENQISEIGENSFSIPDTFYGPYSNQVSVPCNSSSLPNPSITTMVQYYDFTFDLMGLFSLDDDDHLGTEVVELYGYFFVSGSSMGFLAEMPCYFDGFENCYNDEPPTYIHGGRSRKLLLDEWESEGQDFIDGIYPLEYQRLCLSTLKRSCQFEGQNSYYQYHNNTIRVFKQADETFWYGFRIFDYDELSHDDEVCLASVYMDHGTGKFTLDPDETDSGNCWVKYTIKKVGDPVPVVIPDF